MSKYKLELPPTPAGKDYARDSFWWTYRQRFSIPMKFGWKIKPVAFEWFDRKEKKAMLNGTVFPPNPTFQPAAKLPMPWDGRDEKAGRVPRTGK